MKGRQFLIIALAVSAPSFACVQRAEYPLTVIDNDLIHDYLDTHYDEIDSNSTTRQYRAYGYGRASQVEIEFTPHKTIGNLETFYALDCNLDLQTGWNCGDLIEKNSLSFDNPDDYVEIESGVDQRSGNNIVASIRNAIVVDDDGRYRFKEWDEMAISNGPLDLLRIQRSGSGTFKVYARWDEMCSFHIIEVREISCGLDQCSYEVVKNEVVHFV